MSKLIQQHYQTCSDYDCPLFDVNKLECSTLRDGNCKYQTIHMLQDASNQCLDGKRHGLYRSWYDNGQLRHECNYVNSERHRTERCWHENGKLELEHTYLNGKKEGLHRYWHSNGKLWEECNYIDDNKHGFYRLWYEDGKLYAEYLYINGIRSSWIYKFFYKLFERICKWHCEMSVND